MAKRKTFPPSPLGDLLLKLAASRTGFRSLDPEIETAGFTSAQASHKAVKLVNAGKLHSVHLGHKHVRYFGSKEHAEGFRTHADRTRRVGVQGNRGTYTPVWSGGKAPPGPGVITPETKITVCPAWPGPRFRALDEISPLLKGHRL